MISSQQGREFTTHKDDPVKYGNIKKVYSIWICTETSQKRANSIEKYDMRRDFLVGHNDDSPRYDILNAILINISEKHDIADTDNETIKLLTDLFNERISGKDKVTILQKNYGLPMTREYKEVIGMCTYADAIEKKGIEQGLEQGLEQGETRLANLINKLISSGRSEDIEKVTKDSEYREKMYIFYGLKQETFKR